MSKADNNFIKICRNIIDNGTTTEGQKVRPVWEDGTPAYTIKEFGSVTCYDLSEEFPVHTLRKVACQSAFDEMLWIYQKKSNNIHELNSHVWDEWADESGSIGKAYGYQAGIKHKYKGLKDEDLVKAFGTADFPCVDYNEETIIPDDADKCGLPINDIPVTRIPVIKNTEGFFYVDQVDMVLFKLKTNPFDRAIMLNLYNMQDVYAMGLRPCAYSMTFNVTQKPGHEKLTLNGILNQRSQDMLAAFAWNEIQYSVLLAVIAQCCDMEPGEFMHIDADAHIYDRHIPMVEELIKREPQPAPKVWINPDIHDFYQFTRKDVKLIDYIVAGEQITNIPIAV